MSSDLGGINSGFLEDVFVKSTLSRSLDIITKLTLVLPFSHAIIYTPMHTHTHMTLTNSGQIGILNAQNKMS